MIEYYFKNKLVITRMRKSYFGDILDDFVLYLHNRGHRKAGIMAYCQAIQHLGQWLLNNRVPIQKINKKIIRKFLTKHIPACKCVLPKVKNKPALTAAINHLLKIITIDNNEDKINPHLNIINTCSQGYSEYLSNILGLSPKTLTNRRSYIRLFLEYLNLKSLDDLNHIKPRKIMLFVKKYFNHYKSSSIGVVSKSLRSFFRYLIFKKYNVKHLIKAVPTVANWSISRPPNYLGQKDFKKFLSAFDRKTSIGKRDYAIARCLTDLGLRSHEVSEIKLDDLNWREGIILIRGKGRQLGKLPLPKSLSDAIASYLKYGRPKTSSKSLFVFHSSPVGRGIRSETVIAIIRRTSIRAGFPAFGSHMLRRSFATQLLHMGNSIKDISDILQHKSITTTMRYTQVDLPHLKCVIMPWPVRNK
jgi:site-specific recombinase XerD